MAAEASLSVMKKTLQFLSQEKDSPPPRHIPACLLMQTPGSLPIPLPYSRKTMPCFLLDYHLYTQGAPVVLNSQLFPRANPHQPQLERKQGGKRKY